MGEDAFEEVVIAARCGTLFIRGGYGREEVYLGLARDQRPEGDPDIVIALTPLVRQRLIEALTEMPSPPSELCWFCDARLPYPVDAAGRLHVDVVATRATCGGTSRTTEDEDDEGRPAVCMAPVRCGHGVDHDEHCSQCARKGHD